MLVEDNPGNARLIEETIGETDTTFEIIHANRLSEARKLLRESEFHVILLDLLLPDGTGIDTFLRLVALVVHHSDYDGYKRLSLTRASAVENCHSTVALC